MSDKPIPNNRIAISNHRIDLFRCPHLFRQMVLLKFRELKDPSAERGSWAHTFLEQYVRHLLESGQAQDTSFGELLFDQLWTTQPMPPEFKQELYDLTVGYIHRARFDIETVVEPEMAVNFDWDLKTLDDPFDKRIWFRARLDLLSFEKDEIAVVDDYKSSWRIVSESELRDERQAQIYAWVVFYLYESIQKVKVRFRYVRYKKSSEVIFTRQDVEHVERMLREVSEQIEHRRTLNEPPEKAWPAVAGEVCTFCAVRCPMVQTLSETDQVVSSHEQAVRLAQEYIALDKAYEKHKKLLKIWIDEKGPIEVSGKSVGYFVEERKNYDSKTIVDTLMGMGYNVEGFFNVSSDGVKEFIKAHPETATLFSGFCQEKSQTKFAIGNSGKVITDLDQQPKPKQKREKKKKEESAGQEIPLPEAETVPLMCKLKA